MESLVAWVKVNQKSRLRVIEVDGDTRMDIVRRFGIREFPSLVLLDGRRIVGRLEGRATGNQIDDLIRPHLASRTAG
jgi:thioredoxin-like negative regulator of GroEL